MNYLQAVALLALLQGFWAKGIVVPHPRLLDTPSVSAGDGRGTQQWSGPEFDDRELMGD